MGMADLSEYRVLYGIEFSPDVRKLMSLFAECWEECYADDCTTCKYRHGRDHYKLMYCLSERYAEKLIANGVTVQERGYWASLTDCANAGVYCSVCHKKVYKTDYAWCNRKNKLRSAYCPNCGAKMDKEE